MRCGLDLDSAGGERRKGRREKERGNMRGRSGGGQERVIGRRQGRARPGVWWRLDPLLGWRARRRLGSGARRSDAVDGDLSGWATPPLHAAPPPCPSPPRLSRRFAGHHSGCCYLFLAAQQEDSSLNPSPHSNLRFGSTSLSFLFSRLPSVCVCVVSPSFSTEEAQKISKHNV
jgi:hypothetical protein